jgi:hypothetical protein
MVGKYQGNMRYHDGVRWIFLTFAWMVLAANGRAQDTRLEQLRTTLLSLRAHANENLDVRGATPELTTAKHQLRDWIESRLEGLKSDGNTDDFARSINGTLVAAKMPDGVDDQNNLGTVLDVRLHRESGLLFVITSLGILCGEDDSAYAYQWSDGQWKRYWESGQEDYTPKKYLPQHIEGIHVWEPVKERKRLVLTLGSETWCSSAWHNVYYRLWRIDSAGTKLLLDETKLAWLRTYKYIVGSVGGINGQFEGAEEALIEFTTGSIDGGVHNREVVRHYIIEGDRVRRVDPVALSPRDFVDEWLTHPWIESAGWSNAAAPLQSWHEKLRSGSVTGEFDFPTKHCQTPDLWQVAYDGTYFLVRWRPPYHFTMMNVSDKPWPLCNKPDPQADEWRTLFSSQDWR